MDEFRGWHVLSFSRISNRSSNDHFHYPVRMVIYMSRDVVLSVVHGRVNLSILNAFTSLTISGVWLSYRAFHLRVKQRQRLRSIESQVATDNDIEPLVENGKVVANGKLPELGVPVNQTRKPAAKDVPSCFVAVTALGKLGLIMAYFYLCDRYSSR